MPSSTYMPGMTFEEFLTQNGYLDNPLQGYIAWKESRKMADQNGGDAPVQEYDTSLGPTNAGESPGVVSPDAPREGSAPGSTGAAPGNPDAAAQLQGMLDRITAPNYALGQFSRMAADATPSTADFLARTIAFGGNRAMAEEQQQAAAARAQSAAFNAYGQFRTGIDSLAAGISGDLLENEQFIRQLTFSADQASKDRKAGFWNDVLSGAFNIGGQYLGSKLYPPQQGGYGGQGGATQFGMPPYWNPFGNPSF